MLTYLYHLSNQLLLYLESALPQLLSYVATTTLQQLPSLLIMSLLQRCLGGERVINIIRVSIQEVEAMARNLHQERLKTL